LTTVKQFCYQQISQL